MARINWNKTFCYEQWLFDIDKSKKSKKKNNRNNNKGYKKGVKKCLEKLNVKD